jgi:RNA polymerase sigma-70 factor (ECF subfamily)
VDDERQLVADVLGRRPGAFERLVRDYQGLCWHVIQRMVRNPEDTRELCQEAFLRVHRKLHQYRFDAPLKAWIGQVAYSVALRHLERRRIPVDEAGDEALDGEWADEGDDVLDPELG